MNYEYRVIEEIKNGENKIIFQTNDKSKFIKFHYDKLVSIFEKCFIDIDEESKKGYLESVIEFREKRKYELSLKTNIESIALFQVESWYLSYLKKKLSKIESNSSPEQNKNIKLATIKKGKLHISNKYRTYFIIALKEKYLIEVSKLIYVLRKTDGTKLSESSFKKTSQNYNVKPDSYKTVLSFIESNKNEILNLFE